MGADTTSSQLIFFIAATTVAVAAAAMLSNVVLDLSGKVDVKGRALGDSIITDIKIANDPALVPNNPVLIYVKNTGTKTLDASLATLILDGVAVTTTNTVIGDATTTWDPGEVAQLSYSATLSSAEDHTARVLTENGVYDELRFRVS